MGIKRYYLTKDNTISNAFKSNLSTRATGSNMGAADILETFVIHGQTDAAINATNAEQSRVLIEFDVDALLSDITAGTVPSSSVDYVLKMYNAPHASTTPMSYSLDVAMVKETSWQEGSGLDMDNYSDLGKSNWMSASSTDAWATNGGDYWGVGSTLSSSFFFSGGTEDLELNINFAVDKWRTNEDDYPNYGMIIKNTDPVISGSEGTYFTKMFFGRTSEFFLMRPYVEAKWDSSRKDNRGNFVVSSSMLPPADNVNVLYLYNRARGQLVNIPGLTNDTLSVEIFSGTTGPAGESLRLVDGISQGNGLFLTGGLLIENGVTQTGIYTCSFASALTGTAANQLFTMGTYFDVWSTGSVQFYTGSFSPEETVPQELLDDNTYVTTITNLHGSYTQGQKPILRLFTRKKDWSPTIYTVATTNIRPEIIEDAYYRVFRVVDGDSVVPFGTGSFNKDCTRLSYDVSGNYFQLDTSCLDTGYMYGVQFTYYLNGVYENQKEIFKFRVDDEEIT